MSFWELILIVLVALIVIHPKRLPEISYTLGRLISNLQLWYQEILQTFKRPL